MLVLPWMENVSLAMLLLFGRSYYLYCSSDLLFSELWSLNDCNNTLFAVYSKSDMIYYFFIELLFDIAINVTILHNSDEKNQLIY